MIKRRAFTFFFKGIWILFKKEFKDVFLSPFVYILGGLFCLIMGWLFFNYLLASKEFTTKTIAETVLIPLFGNMNFVFLFLAPLLTMRLISEEKKAQTIELLLTSHLNSFQIILGKLLSSLVMVSFFLSLTAVFPITLALSGYTNWPLVLGGYGGVLLSVMSYLSVGLWASSLTENQVIAALLAFCLLLGLMLLVLTSNATDNFMVAQILQYVSVPVHFESFLRGGIRSYNFIFLFSFSGFFLYLTHLTLESRKW